MKRNLLILLGLLFIAVLFISIVVGFAEASDMEHIVSWTDGNVPPADSFIVYRSLFQDSGYVEVAETADTMWTDENVIDDERVWYKVSAVKDYMESDMSDWVTGRSVDLTNEQFNTSRLVAYYPGNDRIALFIYPPVEDCTITRWRYMVPDIIRISCGSEILVVPTILIR